MASFIRLVTSVRLPNAYVMSFLIRLHACAWVRHREKRLRAGVTPGMSRLLSGASSRSRLNPRQDSAPNRILKEILGIDGSYVDPKRPTILLECIILTDVIMSLRCSERYGKSFSSHVGEHLPHDSADTLVSTITGLVSAVRYVIW